MKSEQVKEQERERYIPGRYKDMQCQIMHTFKN